MASASPTITTTNTGDMSSTELGSIVEAFKHCHSRGAVTTVFMRDFFKAKGYSVAVVIKGQPLCACVGNLKWSAWKCGAEEWLIWLQPK